MKPSWWGMVILVFALMALVMGTISSGFFLSRVSLLLLICGAVVFLAGWEHLAAISFPLAFLILMIPSSTLVDQITFPLQILASKTATFLLTAVGVTRFCLSGVSCASGQFPWPLRRICVSAPHRCGSRAV